MITKYKILVVIVLILIIAGAFWYVKNKNTDSNDNHNKISFITGFTLLDDEKNLDWNEAVQLGDDARAQFEKKVAEIKADLITATDKEQRLAYFNDLAIYEKYLGNYREAYDAYLQALNLESQARVTWQNFADVLLKIKASESAEMAYKKAIELNKYIPESYVKLADYYKTLADNEKVEATYKTAIETIKESMESDALVLDAYAEWLGAQKRVNDAIKIYEELIVKQPANKEAIERKIEALKKMK